MFNRLRQIVRKLMLDLISISSKPQVGIHILNGHYFSKDNTTDISMFRNQLMKLSENGVRFINFDKAVQMISEKNIDTDQCYVAFSFDDGFEECYTKIRPVLNEFNVKAAFFINPNFINGDQEYRNNFKNNIVYTAKNPMTWEQIKGLKNEGHFMGSHTMDHLNLNTDDEELLEYQVGESKRYLENKLNINCEYFSFPFGQFKYISELGIRIASHYHKFVFSQSNYRYYYSCNEKVINRRHFECFWPYKHVLYFLKSKKLKNDE